LKKNRKKEWDLFFDQNGKLLKKEVGKDKKMNIKILTTIF
jgi:hypothetical protein